MNCFKTRWGDFARQIRLEVSSWEANKDLRGAHYSRSPLWCPPSQKAFGAVGAICQANSLNPS